MKRRERDRKREESGIGEDTITENRIEIKRRRQVRGIRRGEDRTEEERR